MGEAGFGGQAAGNGAGGGSRVWFWCFGLKAWRMGCG